MRMFFLLITLFMTNVYGKYDCTYLNKYCKYSEYPEDIWGDFYCGDFRIRYEVDFEERKFIFKKNGDVFIDMKKIGELPQINSEFLLHKKGNTLLLESNMHEEVGSFGTVSIVDLKNNKLVKIGETSPELKSNQLEILKDKINYLNGGFCWDYNLKTGKTSKYSKNECIKKLKNKVEKVQPKTVKATYIGKKDEFGNYIPNTIRTRDLACSELIIGASIRWKKKSPVK